MSWITDPQTGDELKLQKAATLKGFAFAGDRGLRQVDISTDGGQTWELARLNHPLSPYSWVFWTYQWSPPRLGDHRLMARATDGTGQVQSSTEKAPFPDGASGLQEVIVAVEE